MLEPKERIPNRFSGKREIKEKKTRMRVLTNFDETISLEPILNSLCCDSWTMNNLLPMDHSC